MVRIGVKGFSGNLNNEGQGEQRLRGKVTGDAETQHEVWEKVPLGGWSLGTSGDAGDLQGQNKKVGRKWVP